MAVHLAVAVVALAALVAVVVVAVHRAAAADPASEAAEARGVASAVEVSVVAAALLEEAAGAGAVVATSRWRPLLVLYGSWDGVRGLGVALFSVRIFQTRRSEGFWV